MLIHLVCWKYREDVTETERENHRAALRALREKIAVVEDLQVGADILHLQRSYDTGLYAKFADEKALQIYSDDAEHQKVVAMGRELSANIISVDFLA